MMYACVCGFLVIILYRFINVCVPYYINIILYYVRSLTRRCVCFITPAIRLFAPTKRPKIAFALALSRTRPRSSVGAQPTFARASQYIYVRVNAFDAPVLRRTDESNDLSGALYNSTAAHHYYSSVPALEERLEVRRTIFVYYNN